MNHNIIAIVLPKKCLASQEMALSGLVDACSFTEPDWIHETDEPFINRRDRLPEPAECPKRPGVWELIKDFVGMDLAKVSHACSIFDGALHFESSPDACIERFHACAHWCPMCMH